MTTMHRRLCERRELLESGCKWQAARGIKALGIKAVPADETNTKSWPATRRDEAAGQIRGQGHAGVSEYPQSLKLFSLCLENSFRNVTLVPEESEDMWHAYNLIAKGDSVRSTTIRKVQNETATGSSTSSRVRTTLTIAVESIDFDTQACVLRLKGRNIEENQYVKMGAYHTLDLELNRKFELRKPEWDTIALERIEMACDPTQSADVAAVVMQEGLAHVCLITASMTLVRSKIEVSIPRKRKGSVQQHEKGLAKFYEQVMQSILRHVNFDVVKCVLIASPGFVRDQFYDYMFQQAVKMDYKLLLDNKSKFMLVHASSGFKHSLRGEPFTLMKRYVLSQILAFRNSSGSRRAGQDVWHQGSWWGQGPGTILHDAAMWAR